ncbi:related to ERG6 S-adenosyl-methionine delta-24-sterol-c-methyltransferase [Cephalotrichum gorgonifer]|uniref:Related to ERG6 S-adenosyl-methionine delta-24-sterol-c-methyltransferase n=1 Tax=Cephalotrichum gorgonifer TaxID=2041049 RepID=A0AAE8N0I3_9PEZI|nr:related to ERG6 S-adenosyl-methionine delta-24-sterol-c-methyltransferase [Cephalotrichum gorgonifer]
MPSAAWSSASSPASASPGGFPRGSRVLDAGCGDGQVAIFLASKGLRLTGIDVMVRHLQNSWRNIRKAGLPAGQVEVLYADYHHLEHIPDALYDGVYTMETLLHATDPAAALAGFFRVLRPGGRLVLHESEHPEDTGDRQGRDKVEKTAAINELAAMPTNQVTASGFYRKLLEDTGFVDIEEEDLSENIRPLARLIYAIEIVPYYIIRLFRLDRYFVNVIAGVRGFTGESPWSYVVIDATKPGGTSEDGSEKKEE